MKSTRTRESIRGGPRPQCSGSLELALLLRELTRLKREEALERFSLGELEAVPPRVCTRTGTQ